ncbi:MAG: citramalate synthase [Acidobacteriota bacterium]
MNVQIYDTTLRDGSQSEGISFSADDKIKIAKRLDRLGVSYIEGGWPGSNPKDLEFFQRASEIGLENARLTAFGSTRRPGVTVQQDANVKALLESGTGVVCIVGKTWDFHVTKALETTLEENLAMVRDTIQYLKEKGLEVFFDAEHFFDGYKANSAYALKVCQVAEEAGADCIVLCDTNGGTLSWEIETIMKAVKKSINAPLGIHAHNDSGCAVSNSLAAVRHGATQVQGTFNGYGERCGNADLCSIIPNLEVKMNKRCLPPGKLKKLTETSRYISEISNMPHANNQPFVGHGAFAHKGGIHVSALLKNSETYEHMDPEAVGNHRRVLVSELAGVSNLLYKAKEFNLDINSYDTETRKVIKQIKDLENDGFQFEGAEASLELLLRKAFGHYEDFFQLQNLKIMVEKREDSGMASEAIIKIKVNDQTVHTAAEGDGPVNALDNALRKALADIFPQVQDMHLSDYKVRVLDGKDGTAAKVRVLIESASETDKWNTVGVSENIIEASWQALVDSINYLLMKQQQEKQEA